MLVLAGILLGLGALVYVAGPLVRHVGAPLADGPDVAARLRELHALKDVVYETLQDVEYDYHAGKIGEGDYREMTDRYTREAVDLVRRIETIEKTLPRSAGRRPDAR